MHNSDVLAHLEKLVQRSVKRLRDRIYRTFGYENLYRFVKDGADGTPCSFIDQESEEILFDEISNSCFRSYNIHSEETGLIDKGAGGTLLIDPVDGTRSVSSLLEGTISIAIAKRDLRQTLEQASVQDIEFGCVGYIFAPQLFSAEVGNGAFLSFSDTDIRYDLRSYQSHTSSIPSDWLRLRLPESMSFREKGGDDQSLAFANIPSKLAINAPGSPASICLTRLASGNDDIFLGFGYREGKITWGLKTVDFAGSYPILKEAGGEMYDLHDHLKARNLAQSDGDLLQQIFSNISTNFVPLGEHSKLELQKPYRLVCVRKPEMLVKFAHHMLNER